MSARTRLEVTSVGRVAPQGSKNRGRARRTYEASKHLPLWRQTVIEDTWQAMLANPAFNTQATAYRAIISFRFQRPKSHHVGNDRARPLRENVPSLYSSTPDVDKCARAVLDAVTQAGAIPDDRMVVHLAASKFYTNPSWPSPGMALVLGVLTHD